MYLFIGLFALSTLAYELRILLGGYRCKTDMMVFSLVVEGPSEHRREKAATTEDQL